MEEQMTLWGGRFSGKLDPGAWALNTSIGFDKRLAHHDICGSLAWAVAIQQAGVLTKEECKTICQELRVIDREIIDGSFTYMDVDEDIHTAVERRLGELIGDLASKLHTGRSRNDQVATDFRMWMLSSISEIKVALSGLQRVLVERAEHDLDLIMPGYTHLQRAQPILLGHWWLSIFWPLQRDQERLNQLSQRVSIMPLGSGALAGTSLSIDRPALAQALGFSIPSQNSLDAVSDRDFVAEFLFITALVGVHLSRLAESVILFSTAEFGFFELSDAYSTGSSLMPQKKNPDIFELTRGKAGALNGLLCGLLTTLKWLPSAYDKDLQEDKVPVFTAYDTLVALLPVLAGALASLTIHPERMQAAIEPAMLATDLADYLVEAGLPFRQAHHLTGLALQLASKLGKTLDQLTMDELNSLVPQPIFNIDVAAVFDPTRNIRRRHALGGTAPQSVANQLVQARSLLSIKNSPVY
jgi:argininosuccinate lyase